jgi:hypothetical protein
MKQSILFIIFILGLFCFMAYFVGKDAGINQVLQAHHKADSVIFWSALHHQDSVAIKDVWGH